MAYQRDYSMYQTAERDDLGEFAVHVERLWAQLLHGRLQQPQYSPSVVRPAIDVYETADAVVVVVEAPGMRDREMQLEVDAGRLTIRGEKRGRVCNDAQVFSQMEIATGPFLRTVDLPAEVNPERVTLSYHDGYVEIRLPRAQVRIERMVRVRLR